MSELEFEELKGFMDLGFVFSDSHKDSRLVSIIPGLQRLGKNNVQDSNRESGETSVSRPYLSDGWECLEKEKREKEPPLMEWRIPAFGNEMELCGLIASFLMFMEKVLQMVILSFKKMLEMHRAMATDYLQNQSHVTILQKLHSQLLLHLVTASC